MCFSISGLPQLRRRISIVLNIFSIKFSFTNPIVAIHLPLFPAWAFRVLIRLARNRLSSRCPGSFSEAKWVNPLHRVRSVGKKVDSTCEKNWIFRYEPPNPRIIVLIPIVMQPRLMIVILPLEPYRVHNAMLPRPLRTLLRHLSPCFVFYRDRLRLINYKNAAHLRKISLSRPVPRPTLAVTQSMSY
ncbi:hypothetical protein PS684_05772 [Pseudomonas fluorescens]|nr:hypothetical protein PS681_05077 [Pseudomonas fluorescens]VVN70987.1 hypothetical protein PS684_05772 [Pseudomonas fluorescens]